MRLLPIVALASTVSAVSVFFVSSTVQAQTAGFADVPGTHWAAQSVAALAQKGIIGGQSSAPLGGAAATGAKGKGGAAYDGNKPVTRYELAVTLYRFVQYIEHADKMKKTKYGAEALPISGPEALKSLIAQGYLPANTPLAKETGNPSPPISWLTRWRKFSLNLVRRRRHSRRICEIRRSRSRRRLDSTTASLLRRGDGSHAVRSYPRIHGEDAQ